MSLDEKPIRASDIAVGPSEEEIEAQLLKLTRSRKSGTRVQAEGAVLRGLLRRRQLARERVERAARPKPQPVTLVWPSETPRRRAARSYWPHDGTMPREYSEAWEELDRAWEGDTCGHRDACRERAEGPPPWKVPAAETRES